MGTTNPHHDNRIYSSKGRLQNTAKDEDSQIKAQKKAEREHTSKDSINRWNNNYNDHANRNPLGSRGIDQRNDETYIGIHKTPRYPNEDRDTGGKPKEYGKQEQQDLETKERSIKKARQNRITKGVEHVTSQSK